MNVVDSSGWLEYLTSGPQAKFFAAALEDQDQLIVPSITVLEVFRKVNREMGEELARNMVGQMKHGGLLVNLDFRLAIEAGRLGQKYGLPLADSIIYATARIYHATLWTLDADFK